MKWTTNRLAYHDKYIFVIFSWGAVYAVERHYRNGARRIVSWVRYKQDEWGYAIHGQNKAARTES